ncbi:hypothetical protein [Photobacterium sp. OFAV2-7]|uniref:hypothetical protein n=1 Tax=Photobacterium sp. OFAV2-7 TaxID=2917748 RepID=UPI001EF6DC29|nr:hypothetical protein [Photobacterium sp. OFAV2-7]MCG7585179.1 hypothetical protein [Photobacterium sp. OFAV2-7]
MSTIIKSIALNGDQDNIINTITIVCNGMETRKYKLASSFTYGQYLVLIFQKK